MKPSLLASAVALCAILCATLGSILATGGTASAQPPGTPPPQEVFDEDRQPDSSELPIRAFLFLSELKNPVIMPGMTWEKLQQLIDLDAGGEDRQVAYSYQSLEIKGTTDGGRAELEVVLRAVVQPTGNRWISIPLKMGNFHQFALPDVTGVDEYDTGLLPDGSGSELRVRTDRRANVSVKMYVSARIAKGSLSRSLEFRLPDIPSRVELITDSKNATGEVMGRGDETAIPEVIDDQHTKFVIESSGGTFFLRWGESNGVIERQLLEAESRVDIRWTSPQESPIANVRTSIESLRGPIDRFQIRVPQGATMLKPPQLDSTGLPLESTVSTDDQAGSTFDVLIPEEERRPRIDISYDLQLTGDRASADRLPLQIPDIVGSLRHSGALEIRTSSDFRLRWRAKPWIHAEPNSDPQTGELTRGATREYRFRFDRVTSDFPIWLDRKESQLRMVNHAIITIQDSIARLDMTIRAGGEIPEGNLLLDEASWQLHSIEDLDTEQPLDSFVSDQVRVIEVESDSESSPASIRILADFPLESDDDRVEISLPRVVDLGEAALVQNATVDIVSTGRSVFVVDLNATKDLRRTSVSSGESNNDRLTSHFQVLNLDSSVVIVGNLVDQPPQITLAGNAKVELDGRQLRTKVDWTMTSRTDLEGRLPVRIPHHASSDASNADLNRNRNETRERQDLSRRPQRDDPAVTNDEANRPESADGSADGTPAELPGAKDPDLSREPDRSPRRVSVSPWIVTVDGVPATLRRLDDDRYELISDRLGEGSMSISWQHVVTIDEDDVEGSTNSISLPRPNVADVTLRGTVGVTLGGNQRFDLVSIDDPHASELQLNSLPRDPLLLRLNRRRTSREALSIQQSILTTVVGRETRHEQILVRVLRGEQLRIALPGSMSAATIQELSVKGFIDGESSIVRRDQNMLIMTLPGDSQSHVVDLRIWYPKQTASSLAMVEPTLKLPPEAGRMFWQIITPSDGHAVWTTPTLGRSMTWRFNGWNLNRTPTHSPARLAELIPSVPNPLPMGNRYLYVGNDIASFRILVISRALIWLVVGAIVLVASALLVHVPVMRHPLTVVAVAVLFSGLLVVAPDAAVLAGQLGIISTVLVAVMITVRTLLTPTNQDRVFAPVDLVDPSNQERSAGSEPGSIAPPAGIATTPTTITPSPSEASS